MATLYITEFATQGRDAAGQIMALAAEPCVADQTVAISGTHAESAAVNALTKFLRVHTDTTCSIAIGTAPVATAVMRRLPANSTEYFSVPLGESYKVSVISNT